MYHQVHGGKIPTTGPPPEHLPHPSLQPLPGHCIPDLSAGGDAQPWSRHQEGRRDMEDHQRTVAPSPHAIATKVVGASPQTIPRAESLVGQGHRRVSRAGNSDCDAPAALLAAAAKNRLAVTRPHPDEKSVSLLTPPIVGLECSFHDYLASVQVFADRRLVADRADISTTGGEGGIRTHGPVARSTVFETAPFDRSGTSPFLTRHRCLPLRTGNKRKRSTAILAERVGFEPTVGVTLHTLSKRAP